jgi:trigger factor
VVEQTAGQLAQQGMDVRKLFTPDLVRSLLDTSRPEAEQRLQARLALEALAAAEAIAVEASAVEARVRELSRELSNGDNRIDSQRLREAVEEDLLREALLNWLEENSNIHEKAAAPAETPSDATAELSKPAGAEPTSASAPAPSAPKPARGGGKAVASDPEEAETPA